ncbi:MAG: leucyl/phenylalanyl-tRNA--protein transferase [Candidatus Nanopelagicales bacterium]|nr:leucyl/phenylalanyl-tRNA--protein transferase [Candidatus Nanopelagicales bacterium]
MRVEPAPCEWLLPAPALADLGQDVIGLGADLAPGTVLQGYRMGLFPMHVDTGQLGWWSPDPRGILRLADLRVSRSLHKSIGQFEVTIDQDFTRVMRKCSASRGDGDWITEEFIATYSALHDMGWAHSVEVWSKGELVGGLYGIEVGGVFAGESMFYRERDASKVALVALVNELRTRGDDRFIDVQWRTEHLASLGAVAISRADYLTMLANALLLEPCFTN